MSDYESVEEVKISKINSAGLINLRMHELWNDANKHKRRGMFSSWNADLDTLWCEMIGDVKEGSKDDKSFKQISVDLAKLSPIINWSQINNGFSSTNLNQEGIKTKQYFQLLKKEAFLRRLQNQQGKGTAYDDDRDDFD